MARGEAGGISRWRGMDVGLPVSV
ncbi:hypothetical protein OOU_Y34scaffold00540g25 [Pyricularia oryzae Y34]|uniref:Uncharacterized protein n=2 Tax=Pyricularia oryzae TaxID=318829 RepID=A0AA97NXW4_PYRO3|nr:hypothetical protein OOU_Y34scaffold00540g25 [Pyricularia oryzae Y34]